MDKNLEALKNREPDTEERRSEILKILNRTGKVRVNQLSKMFHISEVSVRNDLAKLEQEGLLERVHGGAVSTYRAYYRMSVAQRMKTNAQYKKNIAKKTASLIDDDDTLMISSGTTSLYVFDELKNYKNLTIVTNAVYLSQEPSSVKDFNIILLGGILDPKDQLTYGGDVISQLSKYKADKLILSVDGVSGREGISTYNYLEAEVNRQMMARAKKTIITADYTKIGRTSFAHIAPMGDAQMLITNDNADRDEIDEIIACGVDVKFC